jgi:hypothetical protein
MPLQLVHLCAERGSPKFEKAAMRWLERYLVEGSPRLQHFAEITASLANRELAAEDELGQRHDRDNQRPDRYADRDD